MKIVIDGIGEIETIPIHGRFPDGSLEIILGIVKTETENWIKKGDPKSIQIIISIAASVCTQEEVCLVAKELVEYRKQENPSEQRLIAMAK